MVRVKWNADALEQLKGIKQFIEKGSPVQARRVVRLIRDATRKLEKYPEFGAVIPERGNKSLREIRVFHYRIIYHIAEGKIRIVAVVHGARLLAGDMID